jgi:hypothetical protein
MKNALVSPNETVFSYDNRVLGWRVAQVEPDGQTFDVGDPCFWTVCADDVVADRFYYDPGTLQVLPVPSRPIAGQTVSSGVQTL